MKTLLAVAVVALAVEPALGAETYKLDPDHT